jgi:hypothetical protein
VAEATPANRSPTNNPVVRSRRPSRRPDLRSLSSPRTAAFKHARRTPPKAAQSVLDGREHGGIIAAEGRHVPQARAVLCAGPHRRQHSPQYNFHFEIDSRRVTEKTLTILICCELMRRDYTFSLPKILAALVEQAWGRYVATVPYPEWMKNDVEEGKERRPVGRPRKHPKVLIEGKVGRRALGSRMSSQRQPSATRSNWRRVRWCRPDSRSTVRWN